MSVAMAVAVIVASVCGLLRCLIFAKLGEKTFRATGDLTAFEHVARLRWPGMIARAPRRK